jgi:O-antigen/teichoic acid export membrane protein
MSAKEMNLSSGAAGGLAEVALLDGERDEVKHDPNGQHLRTDHLRTDVKHRTISSGFVTLTSQGAKFALSVGSTVILARLLTPHDFGLLAMVTTIMGLLRIFKDAGLSSATIQRAEITQAQVSNLFWINVAVGGSLALIMALAAPAIAYFYREPNLIAITLWLSIAFLVSGSTVQHQALLLRQMRFKSMAIIEVGSITVSLLVGVGMALGGCGYWSLVGMNLAGEGAGFVLTWLVSSWRPHWPKRKSGTRPLLSFGVTMTGGTAVYTLSRSVDSMLVGWRYGADSVGLYSRALALFMRPLDQLMGPVSSVLLPTLSRLQGEPERYRRVFRQIFEGMALVSFVFTGLFFALSRPITLVLLGAKWDAAAIIFRGFTLAALYLPVAAPVAWLLISLGRGKDYLRWNIAYATISISSFLIGLPFGPVGVAFAYSIGGLLIALPILYYLAGRSGPVRTSDLWIGFFRHLPLWIVVAGCTFLARSWADHYSPLVQLLISAPIGMAAAAATVLVIKPQRAVATYMVGAVRGMLKSRKKA